MQHPLPRIKGRFSNRVRPWLAVPMIPFPSPFKQRGALDSWSPNLAAHQIHLGDLQQPSCPPFLGCRDLVFGSSWINVPADPSWVPPLPRPGETDPRSRNGWPDGQALSVPPPPQPCSQEACRKPPDAGWGLESRPNRYGPRFNWHLG